MENGFDGIIVGIDLVDIVQLNCLSGRTSVLKVRTENKEGTIFFNNGNIVHSEFGTLEGEEAFYEIMAFEGGKLESTNGTESPTTTIDKGYVTLLIESAKRLDEALSVESEDQDFDSPSCEANRPISQKKLLQAHLNELKTILGYKAACILDPSGDILTIDSVDPELNLHEFFHKLIDIHIEAREASKKIGLGQCKETVIKTSKGIIVMQGACDTLYPFSVIAILATDGNLPLMKMKVQQLIRSGINEFDR